MDIEHAVLHRLRRALRTEQSLSIGLASQIVAATQHHSALASQAEEARRQAERFPHHARPAGMSSEEWAMQQNERSIARADQDRTMRQLASNPHVRNPDRAVQEDVSHVDPDPLLYIAAAETAAKAAERAAEALAELESERARHGRAAGLLRASIDQAERWMAANHIPIEEAA
jgi:hypothetical protein